MKRDGIGPLPQDVTARRQALLERRKRQEAKLERLRAKRRGQHWSQQYLRFAITVGLKLLGLYGRGRRNADHPLLRTESLFFKDLPAAFDGFRILHLGDFHFDGRPGFAEAIRDLLDPLEVDLCVFTGDSIFEYYLPDDVAVEGLRMVLDGVHARYGVVGCLGNNDYLRYIAPMAEIGVRWLINENVRLEREGESLYVAGVDDPHRFRCADVVAALDGVPQDAFVVLLSHAPEGLEEAAARGVRLCLSGHTHGGQLCLPWIGAVYKNGKCAWNQVHGLWRVNGMVGNTTAGLGCTAVPVRFNCPSEAVLLELHRGSEGPSKNRVRR